MKGLAEALGRRRIDFTGQAYRNVADPKSSTTSVDENFPVHVQAEGPWTAGGQAIVARGSWQGQPVAVRFEFLVGPARLRAALWVAELSRSETNTYPSLVRCYVTFRATLPNDVKGYEDVPIVVSLLEWAQPLTTWLPRQDDWPDHGMPTWRALTLWLPLAGTVARLGSAPNHLVHRDIDESNVLVDQRQSLVLADFGTVSSITPEATSTVENIEAKRRSLPPEGRRALARGETLMDVRPSYDTWQLGRLLYVLLTGDWADRRTEFEDPSVYWARWDRVPQSLVSTLRQLVSDDPSKRPDLMSACTTLRINLEGSAHDPTRHPAEDVTHLDHPRRLDSVPSGRTDAAQACSPRSTLLKGIVAENYSVGNEGPYGGRLWVALMVSLCGALSTVPFGLVMPLVPAPTWGDTGPHDLAWLLFTLCFLPAWTYSAVALVTGLLHLDATYFTQSIHGKILDRVHDSLEPVAIAEYVVFLLLACLLLIGGSELFVFCAMAALPLPFVIAALRRVLRWDKHGNFP